MKKVQQLFQTARRGFTSITGSGGSAKGLLAAAGRTREIEQAGALVEQLEKREYLFVLTVDPNDDTFEPDLANPGFGTVTANFAYFLPFLLDALPAIPAIQAPVEPPVNPAYPGPGVNLGGGNILERNRMAEWLEERMMGVQITLYGRIDDPATPLVNEATRIQIFDLYGRDMQQRLDIGRESPILFPTLNVGGGRNQVVPDDVEAIGDRGTLTGALTNFAAGGQAANVGDGVPDMNDGLGAIIIINSDARTRISMIGGQAVRITDQASFDRSDIFDEDTFYGIDLPEIDGQRELWDELGFGFGIIPNTNPPDISGLPEIAGSIVFGAPFVRDNTDSTSYFGVDNNQPRDAEAFSALPSQPLVLNFTSQTLRAATITVEGTTITTPIVGIRTLNADQAVGEVRVPGLLMGTVNVTGSLGLLVTQHLLGSVSVTGDVGEIWIGGTSGYWVREDQRGDANNLDNLRGTGSSINVGGRLGSLLVAGRNRANVFVVGDTTNPRQRVEGSVYNERETVFGVNPALDEEVLAGALNGGTIRAARGTFRNDGFSTAEFIYSGLSGTTVTGAIGLADPINEEDLADFYAFAANGGSTVQFNSVFFQAGQQIQNPGNAYVRVFDQDGRLIATHQAAGASPADTTNPTLPRTGVNFSFVAPASGVYYVVVGTVADGAFNTGLGYTLTMAGQAATTLGQMVVGGGLSGFTLSVSGGAVGRVSAGSGVIGPDGAGLRAESDASGIPDADYVDSQGFNISVASLFELSLGGDLGGGLLSASGVVGDINVGGSMVNFTANLSRQLGSVDVQGQTGAQQVGNLSRTGGSTGAVLIRTGGTGVPGHIGRLRFFEAVRGDQFTLQTSAGSFVDVLEVINGGFTTQQPTFNMGQGSDIRFASFPSVRLTNPGQQDIDYFLPLLQGVPLTLTDDSGVTFTITATGLGGGGVGGPPQVGTLRVTPAGQFGGVIVGRLDVTLGIGGVLRVTTTSAGSLALGDINVVTTPGLPAQVLFSGPAEIDVRSLTVNGVLSTLTNSTPDGDIVSADVGGVTTVSVNGSLGATRTYMLSQREMAVQIGLAQGLIGAVGAPVGVPANLINGWQGGVFVPFVWDTADAGDRTLEDSGSPIDDVLNGIVIRTGNVSTITARGSIGDVITQGGTGDATGGRVTSIIANSDITNTTGRFEGITGSIFVGELTSLDVGDGILPTGSSPLAQAGVFAIDDIVTINAGARVRNPAMTGIAIVASNANTTGDNFQGIGTINITGVSLDRSFVHVANLDSWWRTVRYGEDRVEPAGTINSLMVTNGNLTRTDIHATNVTTVMVNNGAWDASSVQAVQSIGTISASRFTSSLSSRDPLQYYFNQIRAGLDVGTVRASGATGNDIEDLFISAGRNNTTISARNIVRSNIDIRGNVGTVTLTGDMRATSLGSGRLASMTVGGDIRSSTVRISGAILNLTAQGDITNTEIVSTGPDGRINNLSALGSITGSITSSGPIGTIRATRGDIDATISTTDGVDGNIGTVFAGRDLILRLNMAENTNVTSLQATRHIGRRLVDGTSPDLLDIAGNVTTILAGGVLYSDVRAGGTIGTITSGRALAYLPTADFVTDAQITASGRITSVSINGDFDGSIVSYSGGIGTVTITNGSFRAGSVQRPNRIEARDGDITSVRIVSGHLLGDILALDGSILTVAVTGGVVFGDIGANPNLDDTSTAGVVATERRTQRPVGSDPTAGRDGPTIAAGVNIGTITTTGGLFEAIISAGRTINSIVVGRGIDNGVAASSHGTVIIAGDRVAALTVTQRANGTFVGAGYTGLGADGELGGTAANADTVKSGSIGAVTFRGGTDAVTVAAGLVAGADGAYLSVDDQVAPGISTVTNVQVIGTATNTAVRTDSGTPVVSANLNAGSNSVIGQALPVADGFAFEGAIPGVSVPVTATGVVFNIGGQLRRVVFTGVGTATYSATLGTGTLVLGGTTAGSTLRIEAAPVGAVAVGNLTAIVSRDDASLASITALVDVSGLSTTLDGSLTTGTFRNMANSPVRTGQSIGTFTAGVAGVAGGNTNLNVESRGEITTVRTLNGVNAGVTPSWVRGLSVGTVSIGGQLQGSISSDRNITSATVTGPLTTGSGIRAGYDMTTVTVGGMTTAAISAGGNITSVRVLGSVTDSAIVAGVDLGRNADFGGTGVDADSVSNGNIGTVTVTGNFLRSDIGAGVYQGTDGFLGTADDLLGEGRSTLGPVTITGSAAGSLLNTESYRVISNGTLGVVRAQNVVFTGQGNLLVVGNKAAPDPLSVAGVEVQFIGGVYFATIFFNQAVSPSTLSGALTISEIRGPEPIATIIPLVENADYTVTYSAGALSAVVQFSPTVTSRDLDAGPQQPALAAAGMYRFQIDSSIIRGQTDATRLDGDGDGVAETTDNWSEDFVVGDAGDRFFNNTATTADNSNVDFYLPVDLDVIMSRNQGAVAGTADINRTYTIQGYLGDHPDHNGTFFAQGSDVDVYQLTMRTGQVLSAALASGNGVVRIVALDAGNPGPADDTLIDLTAPGNGVTSPLGDGTLLMLADVTVFIIIDSLQGVNIGDPHPFIDPPGPGQPPVVIGDPAGGPATALNLPGGPGLGAYALAVRIVDDGDNGFDGANDASNGSNIENAPLPSQFAGVDNVLGTVDDLQSITVGQYVYLLDPGANNVFNGNGTATVRSDDRVVGVNQYGTEQVRTAGTDGRFNAADDVTAINSAIGQVNAIGGQLVNASDVDIYHLNAGATVTAGQRYRFTFRVAEMGGDIGGLRTPRPTAGGGVGVTGGDTRGQAQFALFEVTAGATQNSGNLVAQANNPAAYRSTPNTVLASDGRTSYGYDANGDYYMEVTIPPSQANGANDGRFALYVQGAHQSNYTVEIVNVGTATAPVAQSQNFLIETNGGVIDWLEAFGNSVLAGYTGSVNANVPGVGGQSTRAYILQNLVANLDAIFTAAGIDVDVSLSSADFVGESFSTVFVTDSLEPADAINQNFFGVAQRRDIMNANRSDQAVVFAPAVTALGNTVDLPGLDSYIRSLTAAVAQRMGELLGVTLANGGSMANASPATAGGGTVQDLEYNAADTRLANNLRSSFILGNQNDQQLLRRIFQLTT